MSNEQVPQSMKDRACALCGHFEVRFDEERQRWMCLCYWDSSLRHCEEIEESKVLRPDWNELRARAKKVS